MSGAGRGARPWRAPSITATRFLVLAGFAAGLYGPAANAAPDAVDRLLKTVAENFGDIAVPPEGRLRAACGGDPACVLRRLDPAVSARLKLQRVAHPDTDTIRWVKSRRSVGAARRLDGSTVLIALDGFGRKAGHEIGDAVSGLSAEGGRLVLDLRHNDGGDLRRMLGIAAMFAGPRPDALFLVDGGERRAVALPAPRRRLAFARLTVVIGPRTASSAEVLAALLRRHAGAEILGAPSAGKDFVYRVIPLSHDWRLLRAAERIAVPGERLAGGVVPDGPLPVRLIPSR